MGRWGGVSGREAVLDGFGLEGRECFPSLHISHGTETELTRLRISMVYRRRLRSQRARRVTNDWWDGRRETTPACGHMSWTPFLFLAYTPGAPLSAPYLRISS